MFFWKLFETVLHWHIFCKMCRTFKWHLSSLRPIHISSMGHNRGHISDVYQINALLWYKTTCNESESRHFDCQWTFVSFLVTHNQFYREARLTCPLYRSTKDTCICIYVFKRVFNVLPMLKKSVSMQQHFEQFVGKKEELDWSLLDIL